MGAEALRHRMEHHVDGRRVAADERALLQGADELSAPLLDLEMAQPPRRDHGRAGPQPVAIESTGLPDKSREQAPAPAVAETSPTAVPPPSAPEPEKKKRGFWSRVFGKRDKDKDSEKKPQP